MPAYHSDTHPGSGLVVAGGLLPLALIQLPERDIVENLIIEAGTGYGAKLVTCGLPGRPGYLPRAAIRVVAASTING